MCGGVGVSAAVGIGMVPVALLQLMRSKGEEAVKLQHLTGLVHCYRLRGNNLYHPYMEIVTALSDDHIHHTQAAGGL